MADLIDTFNIAASGLSAERERLHTIATNMANARTTRTPEGGPYQRRIPIFSAESIDPFGAEMDRASQRVEVSEIAIDPRPPVRVFEPGHPDADASGYVSYPDINVLQEMVDMMTATRAYEANVTAMNAAKNMALKALDILR